MLKFSNGVWVIISLGMISLGVNDIPSRLVL